MSTNERTDTLTEAQVLDFFSDFFIFTKTNDNERVYFISVIGQELQNRNKTETDLEFSQVAKLFSDFLVWFQLNTEPLEPLFVQKVKRQFRYRLTHKHISVRGKAQSARNDWKSHTDKMIDFSKEQFVADFVKNHR